MQMFFGLCIGAAIFVSQAGEAAEAGAKIKLLIFSGANNHSWQTTTPVLKELYEGSGRFSVDVTENVPGINPDEFKKYDAIICNYTTYPNIEGHRWPAATEKAFLDYISSGHGFVLFHAASTAWNDWPEFCDLIGLTWQKDKITGNKISGHGAQHSFAVNIVDKEHPVTQGMGDFQHVKDELYHRQLLHPKAHVLATTFSSKTMGGSGTNEPMVVVTEYGKGRVFHCAMGHDPKPMSGAGFQTLMLRGAEWAATGKVTIPIPAGWPSVGSAQAEALKKGEQKKAPEVKSMKGKVKLMTLDPGHFHAGLVQKFMYDQVDPVVHVYAPEGADLQEHLKRIEGYNTRAENPTHWQEKVYAGPDFFEKMMSDRPGNVVVLSGNNAKKTKYIMACVDAGLNVLSDKPMAITPDDFVLLKKAFARAKEKGVFLYDIMTERSEITTILQKELSHMPSIFGELEKGTVEQPAVTKESVHHYFKYVSGKPLTRPAWFFDVTQQGEGIVDVTTHLVDLIQWECFPGQILDAGRDVEVISAKRWTTKITPEQFKTATKLDNYPDYLKKDAGADNVLNVYGNGEFIYRLKGVFAKVSVTWNFEAPQGAGDTHYSIMRGSGADLVIRQGKDQNFKPTLYVEKKSGVSDEEFEKALKAGISKLNEAYPGIEMKKIEKGWEIVIAEKYKVGHEAHFAQVTERYLKFLAEGRMPDWEVPDMIVKYYTITKAYEMSR